MQPTIQKIRIELQNLYPPHEIEGFIKIILSHIFSLAPKKILITDIPEPDPVQQLKIEQIISRLKYFEPIQYIVGETEFYGIRMEVNPSVLIPRQETEELVDWILKSEISPKASILDIGTGSGCIALALKKHFPSASVYACDFSEKALETASSNALVLGLNVNFFKCDIRNSFHYKTDFDLIVSNPPYVRNIEKKYMHPNVLNFEPHDALFVPDGDPLVFYREIADFSTFHLKEGGWIYFEINESFGTEISDLLYHFGFTEIEIRKDLNGKNRMVRGKKGY